MTRRAAYGWVLVLLCVALLGTGCGGGGKAGQTVGGEGYEYAVPDGWEDRSNDKDLGEIEVAGLKPDTLVTDDPVQGFAPNVNVLVGPRGSDMSPKQFADQSLGLLKNLSPADQEQLGGFAPRDVGPVERIELAGQEAYAIDYSATQEGADLSFRNVITVHEGKNYVLTFTAPASVFDDSVRDFEGLLDGWRWD